MLYIQGLIAKMTLQVSQYSNFNHKYHFFSNCVALNINFYNPISFSKFGEIYYRILSYWNLVELGGSYDRRSVKLV